MKKIISILLAGAFSLGLMMPAFAADTDTTKRVYVSINGNDAKDGLGLTNAVESLERARDLARIYKEQGFDVEVVFTEGEYFLTDGVSFTSEDSGSEESPVVYRAMQNANVTITTGTKLDWSKFSLSTDERIRTEGTVYEADLADVDLTSARTDALYADGVLKTLAKYPNDTSADRRNYLTSTTLSTSDDSLANGTHLQIPDYTDTDKWGSDTLIEVWDRPYNVSIQNVRAIESESSFRADNEHYSSGTRIAVVNVLYELDTPGEYYVDYTAKKLFYYPHNAGNENIYFMSGNKTALSFTETEHIRIENLNFKANGGSAIIFDGCDDVVVYNAVISGVGDYFIKATDTSNLLIAACEMNQSQEYGIYVSGGNKYNLTPSYNEVRNNRIHDYARFNRTATPGIELGGVGVHLHNNELYNSPHKGIEYSGNDHIIEYNRVYDVAIETWDCGAIYSKRSWIGRGTKIRNNYIYQDPAKYTDYSLEKEELVYGSGTDSEAIYVDDMQSGIEVTGNIIFNYSRGALFGGGSDNVFTDNIMIDVRRAYAYDNAGQGGWRVQHITPGAEYAGAVATEFMDFVDTESSSYSNKEAWNKYNGFPEMLERIADYQEGYAAAAEDGEVTDAEHSALLAVLGRVYNRTVDRNVVVGDWVRRYNVPGDVEHWMSTTFISMSESYDINGNIEIQDPDDYVITYETKDEAGVAVDDNYEITITNSEISDGVSRSTADMCVQADTYIPTICEDEVDEDSPNRFDAITAIYSENGALKKVQILSKVFLYDGQEFSLPIEVPEEATTGWYLKLMLWDSVEGLSPIATQDIILAQGE